MKYGFIVYQIEIENELLWFAESKDLKGCAGQGTTCDEAIRELEQNERIWLQMAEEDGELPPVPTIEKPVNYSGKFTVRLSKDMHKKVSERAEQEGISLNSYIVEAISEKVGSISSKNIDLFYKAVVRFGNVIDNTGGLLDGMKSFIFDMSNTIRDIEKNKTNEINWNNNRYEKIIGDEMAWN